MNVSNTGANPIQVDKFSTAYLDFVNQSKATQDTEHKMTVEPNKPIEPGTTQRVKVTIQDPVWETDKLLPVEEAQISMAGLLFVSDKHGHRDYQTVAAPLKTDYNTILQVLKNKK